ncbi:MAG: RagB/SusD family nutrient uptake outer membrane protein [Bacteroidota bacterium]
MRNILKISVAFVLLLTIGCSKEFLDPVPQTSLSDLSVFDNKDRVVAQVNGMYSAVKSGWYLGGRYQSVGDMRGDNFAPLSNNAYVNFNTWNHLEISATMEVNNIWNQIYASVNVINIFMDGLKSNWDAGKLTSKITQEEYDQYISEALTLRAMCYFDLVRLYGKPYIQNAGANPGVPLRIKAEKSAGGNDLARSTVDEVYAQVLADLDAAEPLAILTYESDALNTTRVHKNTIIALKVRVLLAKGDWAGVVSESAKIVSSTPPFVAPSGVANALSASWSDIWTTYLTKESIFSMPNTDINNGGAQSAITWYFSAESGEAYFLDGASPVYAAMDETDLRKSSMVMLSPGGTSPDQYFISKFTHFTTLSDWCPVLRYAEVLLSRAEAIVRSGGTVSQAAVDLLNVVRTRSFPTGAYTLASFATATDFYTAVLQERNFEFLGEGMRSFDLMRLGLDIPAKDGLTMGNVGAIPASSSAYIWPIPSGELSLNKLCTP